MERYVLQPEKSVVMVIPGRKKSKDTQSDVSEWTIYGKEMPVVTETMHMGLRRSSTSEDITINENIKKSRRSFYCLMSADLQGMDPETSTELFKTYVMPVLLYGLEVVLPKQKSLEALERTHKKFMKHILTLPVNTADTSIYISYLELFHLKDTYIKEHCHYMVIYADLIKLQLNGVWQRENYQLKLTRATAGT